jgi:hypothetical protein
VDFIYSYMANQGVVLPQPDPELSTYEDKSGRRIQLVGGRVIEPKKSQEAA